MSGTPILESPVTLTIQCAWCNAVKLNGVYHRCPAIPPMYSSTDNVSHGVCPECLSNLTTDMGRMLD